MEISTALTMGPSVKGLDIEGEVKFIGEVKEMTGEHGAWKSQFILLAENKDISCGASIKIEGDSIDDRLKGKRIKLVGCKVADSTYKGKPSKIIYANGWTPPDASAKLQEITNSAPAETAPKEESPFKKNLPALKEEISQKDKLIVRQVALKAAVECEPAKSKEFNVEVILKLAQYFEDWILGKDI